MAPRGPIHSVSAWRDRLAGRVPFDRIAAEVTVRRAYEAAGLSAPRYIFWAKGPAEAAQALAFLDAPPRVQRRSAIAVLVLGAVVWIGVALAIDGGASAGRPWPETGIWSVVLATLGLALGLWPRPSTWPDFQPRGETGMLVLSGAVVFFALAGQAFALFYLGGLGTDPLGRGVVLALAAAVGAMPGVFACIRLRRAHAHLPRFLLDLSSSTSVVSRLERAQREAWTGIQRTILGLRPNGSLLEAYHTAYRGAFARLQPHFLDSDIFAADPHIISWDGDSLIIPGRGPAPRSRAAGNTSAHLDGLEALPAAASVTSANITGPATIFADLAFHVDRLYPFGEIAVAVEPGTILALDAEGRPHADDGPALAWADGTDIHAWHGRLIPPDVFDPARPITRSRIDHQTDPDRRWVLIERYGLGRYLLEAGATEVEHDDCGQLYRLAQRWSEPIVAVRVVNDTPEPDGSRRDFWLRVPPTMTTAREAVAWTFNQPVEAYDPVAES
jgi:hypothetical protein